MGLTNYFSEIAIIIMVVLSFNLIIMDIVDSHKHKIPVRIYDTFDTIGALLGTILLYIMYLFGPTYVIVWLLITVFSRG